MIDPGNGSGCTAGRLARRVAPLMCVLLAAAAAAGCGVTAGTALTAKQVLERSIEDMLSWQSYRYTGTSSLRVPSDPRLNNEGRFTTDLVLNDEGALDGRMIVESEAQGASYERYTSGGMDYVRNEGGDWNRTKLAGQGAGMVSAESRRIIAEFADLVEDIEFGGVTPTAYVVSMRMGDKYRSGAAAVAGTSGGVTGPAAAGLSPTGE